MKEKIFKVIVFVLALARGVGVFFLVINTCQAARANRIKESGFFEYIVDNDEVAIIGFTSSGQQQETLEIPREIDGKPVKHIGYRDFEETTVMVVHYHRLESENLKKLYVYDNIRNIHLDAFADLPEVSVMWCADTFELSNPSGVDDITRIFVYEPVYESLGLKEPNRFSVANIVFMNNYSDEVNGGYYRLDNVEEDEKIPEPPDPEREGYEFTGWYTEPACENLWSFNESPVIDEGEEFRLYAGWRMS